MNPFRYRIAVEWSDEDKVFIARIPALHGCMAHGSTAEKATHEVRVAADAMLSVLKEDGDLPPPEDTTADFSGQLRIRLPRSLHESLARSAQLEGVSLNQLMVARLAAIGPSVPIPTSPKPTKRTRARAATGNLIDLADLLERSLNPGAGAERTLEKDKGFLKSADDGPDSSSAREKGLRQRGPTRRHTGKTA
jgi:predicted RNase H-like HicB family nuclease